jgi:Domain of unknown function (DUF4314)
MAARVGDRVVLVETSDRHTSLSPGDEGVVAIVDALGTIHVDWDNGSNLALLPDQDRYSITCVPDGGNT